LLEKRGAGEQIDIRIKDQNQHRRRTAERADFGKPVVTRPPPRQIAQYGLHNARMVKNMRIGIGQHVGWKGQRQHQSDLKKPRTRKARHRHEPGRADTNRESAERHQDHQGRSRARVSPKHGLRQMLDRLGSARQRRQQHGQHRQRTECGDQYCNT
jgi:hypothetical protein